MACSSFENCTQEEVLLDLVKLVIQVLEVVLMFFTAITFIRVMDLVAIAFMEFVDHEMEGLACLEPVRKVVQLHHETYLGVEVILHAFTIDSSSFVIVKSAFPYSDL